MQRSSLPVEETGSYVAMSQTAMTAVGVEIAQEYAIETELEDENNEEAA